MFRADEHGNLQETSFKELAVHSGAEWWVSRKDLEFWSWVGAAAVGYPLPHPPTPPHTPPLQGRPGGGGSSGLVQSPVPAGLAPSPPVTLGRASCPLPSMGAGGDWEGGGGRGQWGDPEGHWGGGRRRGDIQGGWGDPGCCGGRTGVLWEWVGCDTGGFRGRGEVRCGGVTWRGGGRGAGRYLME